VSPKQYFRPSKRYAIDFWFIWGAVFLDEAIAMNQIASCVLILSGVALSTGLAKLKKWQ